MLFEEIDGRGGDCSFDILWCLKGPLFVNIYICLRRFGKFKDFWLLTQK